MLACRACVTQTGTGALVSRTGGIHPAQQVCLHPSKPSVPFPYLLFEMHVMPHEYVRTPARSLPVNSGFPKVGA